ncbi:hypothetical protein B0H14DRAFT_1203112 [Mycena olivaceomarginata]|nr:hypothetical protein B0H14DRAFT_1203112 [Mycena olivaceomarginata]
MCKHSDEPSSNTSSSVRRPQRPKAAVHAPRRVAWRAAGTAPLNVTRVLTPTMSETSAISVCFGTAQDGVVLSNAKLELRTTKATLHPRGAGVSRGGRGGEPAQHRHRAAALDLCTRINPWSSHHFLPLLPPTPVGGGGSMPISQPLSPSGAGGSVRSRPARGGEEEGGEDAAQVQVQGETQASFIHWRRSRPCRDAAIELVSAIESLRAAGGQGPSFHLPFCASRSLTPACCVCGF